jgi:hypothetical protein
MTTSIDAYETSKRVLILPSVNRRPSDRRTLEPVSQAGLEIADDPAQQARRQQSRPERSRPVLTEWWKLLESSSGRRRHMAELPLDLVHDSLRAVGGSERSRLSGVGGSPQGVRAHVSYGCRLPSSFGSSHRRRGDHRARSGASDEATPDLFRDVELASGKRSRTGDGSAGTAIARRFRFE